MTELEKEVRSLRIAVSELQRKSATHNKECMDRNSFIVRSMALGLIGMFVCVGMILVNGLKIFGVI